MTTRYDTHGNVAVITLDNPPINSLGLATRRSLDAAVKRALADAGIKAIVITGGNSVFTGGADIREFGKPVAMQSPNLHELIAGFEASDKPIVSAINGVCMGGGTEISLACHYRVAAPGVMIGLPEVKLGLLPGAGGTQRLPRAVSKAKAMDMVLTGRMMDAAEAERAGLVSRVVPAAELHSVVLAAAQTICEFSGPSVMMAKECVNRAYESGLADGVQYERRLFHSLFATDDQKEGMDAFVGKRKAVFKHR